MKIVADTNRLIASLIKDGASRSILRNPTYELFTPDFAFEEIWKHRKEIEEKAELSEEELVVFLFLLSYRITLVSVNRYKRNVEEANHLMGHIDKDDVPFLACAMELDAMIWSEDGDFMKQNRVPVVTTKELLDK